MSRPVGKLSLIIGLSLVGPRLVAQQPPGQQTPGAQSGGPELTISGVLYGQYAYALRDPAGTGHANNFDITRAYLNFFGRFSNGVGGRVTGDIYRNTDGALAYRLKYGYASWNPSKSALTYKFGMTQTPFVEYDENLWEYRMQGQDATERGGYMSSSDFGLATDGTWNGDMVTMTAGVYNGEFYSKAPGDKHKDVEARLSVRLVPSDDPGRYGGLRLTGFGAVGKPTGGGIRNRYLGEVSWRSKRITLAGLVMGTRDRVDTSVVIPPTTKGLVTSVFGVLKFPAAKVALIGRWDWHDRNRSAANDALNRIIAGASYQINTNLRVLADLDHTWYQGGSPSLALDATRSQALFQLQLAF